MTTKNYETGEGLTRDELVAGIRAKLREQSNTWTCDACKRHDHAGCNGNDGACKCWCRDEADDETIVWDLAGAWPDDVIGFTIGKGTVMWEAAQATWTPAGTSGSVRVARLVVTDDGIRQVNQYVDPDARVHLVRGDA